MHRHGKKGDMFAVGSSSAGININSLCVLVSFTNVFEPNIIMHQTLIVSELKMLKRRSKQDYVNLNENIVLYTKKIIFERNQRGICLAIVGLQMFLLFLSLSIEHSVSRHNNSNIAHMSHNELLCNITDINVEDVSFKFTVMNATTCSDEYTVDDMIGRNYLLETNVSIGNTVTCFENNLHCEDIYFYGGSHHQQTNTFLFGITLFLCTAITCTITVISLWINLSRDKQTFYTKQWDEAMDDCLKYEYILSQWCRKCDQEICDDINNMIFEYADCMCIDVSVECAN